MVASTPRNPCSGRTWKIDDEDLLVERRASPPDWNPQLRSGLSRETPVPPAVFTAYLPARIQISHHYMKHLPGHSRIALGNRRLRVALAAGIGVISIRPRDGR